MDMDWICNGCVSYLSFISNQYEMDLIWMELRTTMYCHVKVQFLIFYKVFPSFMTNGSHLYLVMLNFRLNIIEVPPYLENNIFQKVKVITLIPTYLLKRYYTGRQFYLPKNWY